MGGFSYAPTMINIYSQAGVVTHTQGTTRVLRHRVPFAAGQLAIGDVVNVLYATGRTAGVSNVNCGVSFVAEGAPMPGSPFLDAVLIEPAAILWQRGLARFIVESNTILRQESGARSQLWEQTAGGGASSVTASLRGVGGWVTSNWDLICYTYSDNAADSFIVREFCVQYERGPRSVG